MKMFAVSLAMLMLLAAPAMSDDAAEKARGVMQSQKAGVVTLQLVLKEKFAMAGMASQDSESTSEATGTVINAEGLTVLSLFKTDPTALFEALMPDMGGGDMNMSTEISEVRFLMEDGSEIPAEVGLREKDEELGIVRA